MRLTKEEKEICKEYSKRDDKGFVHCHECPLAIDKKSALCFTHFVSFLSSPPKYTFHKGGGICLPVHCCIPIITSNPRI